jgi:hypothetical protein
MVMTRNLEFEGFVGVDVSAARLDVHLLSDGEFAGFDRDRRGMAGLIAWLTSRSRRSGSRSRWSTPARSATSPGRPGSWPRPTGSMPMR